MKARGPAPIFTAISVLALIMVALALSLKTLISAPGSLAPSLITVNGKTFSVQAINHNEQVALAAGQHGIFTAPSGAPGSGMRWYGPTDLPAGIQIYEYSAGFVNEKKGVWSGRSYNFPGFTNSITTFQPGTTYYIYSPTNVTVQFSGPSTAS